MRSNTKRHIDIDLAADDSVTEDAVSVRDDDAVGYTCHGSMPSSSAILESKSLIASYRSHK